MVDRRKPPVPKKRLWGDLTGRWVSPEIRDSIISHLERLVKRTGMALSWMLDIIALSKGKYYHWKKRAGKLNRSNRQVPRDFLPAQAGWKTGEKEAVIEYKKHH